jgi:hypothetical protein
MRPLVSCICLALCACSKSNQGSSPLDLVFQNESGAGQHQFYLAASTGGAPPGTTRIKGTWAGLCIRNGKSAHVTVDIDYPHAKLNQYDVNGLSITKRHIAFSFTNGEGITRTFAADFGTNFKDVKGQLVQSGMSPAECTLSDPEFDANRMCIGSYPGQSYYIWLDPPDADIFPIPAGQNAVRRGDYNGRLCYSGKPFSPPQCPQVTDQVNYVCGRTQ